MDENELSELLDAISTHFEQMEEYVKQKAFNGKLDNKKTILLTKILNNSKEELIKNVEQS